MHRAARIVGQLNPSPMASKSGQSTSTGTLRYTADVKNSKLSRKDREQYEKEGFYVVRGLVPQADLDRYRQRFLDIADGKLDRPAMMTMQRDVAMVDKRQMGEAAFTKFQDFMEDEVLFSYCKHPKVLEYVRSFIGDDIKAMHTMLINKPPDLGVGSSRHPPHQDLWYFPFRPAERIVCAWTAMQKIDKENGCLFVKPGSHTGELLKHEYPNDGIVNKAYHGIQNMSSEEFGKKLLHLEMEPGDCVFFHPLLIHGSGRNNSGRFRKAISCHYANSNCFYESIEGTIQEDVAKELEQMAAKKGAEISFYDIWKYRGRLVAGKDNTL